MDDHLHWWPVIPLSLVYGLTSPHSLTPGNSLLTAVWDNNSLFNLGSSVDLWNTDCLAATAQPALLSHTPSPIPPSPTSRLSDWLDTRYLWLQFVYWNYQSDHRSNPISCLFSEFSKVDEGKCFLNSQRSPLFSPLWTHIKSFVLSISKSVEIFCSEEYGHYVLTWMVSRDRPTSIQIPTKPLTKPQLLYLIDVGKDSPENYYKDKWDNVWKALSSISAMCYAFS